MASGVANFLQRVIPNGRTHNRYRVTNFSCCLMTFGVIHLIDCVGISLFTVSLQFAQRSLQRSNSHS